jgi:hypothetical protein
LETRGESGGRPGGLIVGLVAVRGGRAGVVGTFEIFGEAADLVAGKENGGFLLADNTHYVTSMFIKPHGEHDPSEGGSYGQQNRFPANALTILFDGQGFPASSRGRVNGLVMSDVVEWCMMFGNICAPIYPATIPPARNIHSLFDIFI